MATLAQEDQLAKTYQAYVSSDSAFQRRARLLQSLWRAEKGYPIGEHRGMPLGSRLAMPWAEETLANYLTDTIRQVVRREVFGSQHGQDKLFGYPRIVNDLLSSQPLCINLFGELQQNLSLATRVFTDLSAGRVRQVTRIEFEYSPGRGDLRYTGDNSAFDVYVEYATPAGTLGFIGIEVKYHENLQNAPATHRPRYDEVAALMGCFRENAHEILHRQPLQQLWRDHLLAGSLLRANTHFTDGFFVLLYPQHNPACTHAATAYQACLEKQDTFVPWTLETVCYTLQRHTDAGWAGELSNRYLSFTKIDKMLSICP